MEQNEFFAALSVPVAEPVISIWAKPLTDNAIVRVVPLWNIGLYRLLQYYKTSTEIYEVLSRTITNPVEKQRKIKMPIISNGMVGI